MGESSTAFAAMGIAAWWVEMNSLALSVIIPTIGGRQRGLLALLNSLQRQSLPYDQYEVLVISEHVLPAVREILTQFKNLQMRYLLTGVRGVNPSRNMGLSQARGEYVYFLDDDCELRDEQTLSCAIEKLRENLGLVGVGGRYVLPDRVSLAARVYDAISRDWFAQQAYASLIDGVVWGDEIRPTRQLFGGNACYAKNRLGCLRFDQRIAFGGAEEEFNFQVVRKKPKGLAVSERLAVTHNLKMGALELVRKAYLQGFWYADRVSRHNELLNSTRAIKTFGHNNFLFSVQLALYKMVFYWGRVVNEGGRSPSKIIVVLCSHTSQSAQRLWLAMRGYVGWRFVWRVLWPLSYPLRKVVYVFRYQMATRFKRSI